MPVISSKAIADVPPLEDRKVYHVKNLYAKFFGHFMGQMGAFFGIFFGVRGPDNQWPYAWWAFSFFGGAIGSTYSVVTSTPARIERIGTTVEFFNIQGKSLYGGPMDLDTCESVGVFQNSCGVYAQFVKTEERYEQLRRENAWCKCCICKVSNFEISEIAEWSADHGLEKEVA